MSRKSGDVATVRCKLKLMVTGVQVYFREHCGAVKVMNKVINRRGYMTFTEDCTIRLLLLFKGLLRNTLLAPEGELQYAYRNVIKSKYQFI